MMRLKITSHCLPEVESVSAAARSISDTGIFITTTTNIQNGFFNGQHQINPDPKTQASFVFFFFRKSFAEIPRNF